MSHKVKFGVFIGRFQVPMPHAGHRVAIAQAATQSEHLIILVGSANACPSIKNPWDVKFRIAAIRSMMHQQGFKNYTVLPLNDYPYTDDQWTSDVRQTVKSVSGDAPVTLFGYDKDASTYYLKLFPDWNYREVQSSVVINATEIREQMFNYNSAVIPATVREDWEYYTKTEPEQFKNYPYPDTLNFNCGDALAVCLGHIVLIKRIRAPGRGCWALPGGFKNNNETFFECSLRDLVVESKGTLVIRPDSGDPIDVLPRLITAASNKFGYTVNEKGYKVLNNVRFIWGDGINKLSIQSILRVVVDMMGYSADNLAYGMGGALLQGVTRDTYSFAMKASAAKINGVWVPVVKDPITDSGKKSMSGMFNVAEDFTVTSSLNEIEPSCDMLKIRYYNGNCHNQITFADVRSNSLK